MKKFFGALALAVALPSLAFAETHHFMVDNVHSEVGFKVRHLVAKTPGVFDEYEGEVWLDPDDIAGTLKLSATIQAASVNTRNEQRDNHLRSADFFEVETHPEITFESKSVKQKGDLYLVTGAITMKGVTKDIVLEAEFGGVATNPFTGTPVIGLDLEGKLNRKDFNIEWNKALDAGGFVLSDDVELEIHLEATVPAPEQS